MNDYSSAWFHLFLETQPRTEQEVAFIRRQLPDPPFHRLLDVCCGQGRHARLLAEAGYRVLGVDRDAGALAVAREHGSSRATYLQHDMREIAVLPGTFDAVLSLWQSFGYFDEEMNRDVLRQMARKLRPRGRLILDLYHRRHFERNAGVREVERKGITVQIKETLVGSRLTAALTYGGEAGDTFQWQLFTPEEVCDEAAACGLQPLLVCSEFDEGIPVAESRPRMQLIFERRA